MSYSYSRIAVREWTNVQMVLEEGSAVLGLLLPTKGSNAFYRLRLGDLKGEVAVRREEKPRREEIIMASQMCCHNTLIKTERW
ncbi:hypothetical protein PVAP13_6KG178206 [Panicum virgatum]|uniref:Uncharacterized protein n=1 Tax=Panicum virgatum TaxID=38727 RepID=A0A8T0RBW3_PANVG|nr:hypothetical protein PVAP13_6KG178206 [Panicum virgatum]